MRARATKTREERRVIAAEAELMRAQGEELRLKNDKPRQELQREKIVMFIEFVDKIAPNMAQEDKLMRVAQLMGPLNTLTDSLLQILQVVNISGGTHITAQGNVEVGGDVTGRDQVTS
jgi:hypothetical protein